jgi:hypothetical protein
MNTEVKLTSAERMYKNHLQNVLNYQKRNADKMNEKARRAYIKIKENPEAYALHLEKKRNYYKTYKLKKDLKTI